MHTFPHKVVEMKFLSLLLCGYLFNIVHRNRDLSRHSIKIYALSILGYVSVTRYHTIFAIRLASFGENSIVVLLFVPTTFAKLGSLFSSMSVICLT